jgi:uncharacterized protein
MQEKLRRRYQIQKEVTRGGDFQGKIEISDLTRLAEFLLSDSAEIAVEFNFCQSDYDIPIVEGRVKTRLTVECQRCLKAMEIPLDMEFKLLVNASDDLIAESHLDSIYCEDGKLDIFEVVEDELILGLPLVTMHDDMTCNKFWPTQAESSELVAEENPFSVLAKLKTIN